MRSSKELILIIKSLSSRKNNILNDIASGKFNESTIEIFLQPELIEIEELIKILTNDLINIR